MDNIRNKWILLISILIIFFTLASSYAGFYFKSVDVTIGGMLGVVQIFMPLIGLMLGYSAIVGEKEKGSLNALIAHPVSRFDIIFGKIIGNGFILSLSIVIGFGIGGIVVAFNVPDFDPLGYVLFILSSILLGLIFLSLSIFFSSFFKTRTRALGGAILIWLFFFIIYPLIIQIPLFSEYMDPNFNPISFKFPDWYYGASMISPSSAYSYFISINLFDDTVTSFINSGSLLGIMFLWFLIPLQLALLIFDKKDI